jgi:hypothetical protein
MSRHADSGKTRLVELEEQGRAAGVKSIFTYTAAGNIRSDNK